MCILLQYLYYGCITIIGVQEIYLDFFNLQFHRAHKMEDFVVKKVEHNQLLHLIESDSNVLN